MRVIQDLLYIISLIMPICVVIIDLYILKKGKIRTGLDVSVLFIIFLNYFIKMPDKNILVKHGIVFAIVILYFYVKYRMWKKREDARLIDAIIALAKHFYNPLN